MRSKAKGTVGRGGDAPSSESLGSGPMAEIDTAGARPGGAAWTQELERILRSRLAGRRIVAEIGLNAQTHEQVVEAITLVVRRLHSPRSVATAYPALLVCYLAGHGIYGYSHGGLWSTVTVPGIDVSFGPAFERAIRALGLETFEDMVAGDNAQRYVAPILAHGGIPKYSLDDLFTLVLKDVGKATDAADLMGLWRTRKSAFFGVDKPVSRFFLYGGGLARDFLDRCLDLVLSYARTGTVPEPDEVGLPAHVVVGFRKFGQRVPPELRRYGRRWPRPEIRLDPWATGGPELTLPPVEVAGRAAWHLQADGQLERVETSRHDAKTLQLRPSRSWTVALVEDGATQREITFEGVDADEIPALFFEPTTGRLLEAGAGLRADELWILSPPQTKLEGIGPEGAGALSIIDELPSPTGAWSGYAMRHVTLRDVRAISVSTPGGRERRLTVRSPAARPVLVGPPLPGVRTIDGLPVYASLPELALPGGTGVDGWAVRITVGGSTVTAPATDLPQGPGGLQLDPLCDPTKAATVELLARGTSLGSDLRAAFALVPGLRTGRPDRLLLPGDRDAVIDVSAAVPLQPDGPRSVRLAAGPDDHQLALDIPASAEPLRLAIGLPRLLWAAARTDQAKIELAGRKLIVDADDVADGTVTALVVRTGLPGLPLRLRLVAGGEIRQDTGAGACASGDDGRWVFDLARFRDTIRNLDEPVAHLELEAGQWPVRVGEVRPALHIHDLRAVTTSDGDYASVELHWEEDRPLRNRTLRLWPLDRPWESPISEPVPDDVTGTGTVSGYERIPAGSYLAELAIDDGWTAAHRPSRHSETVTLVRVGDATDFRLRLDRLSLDDPLHVLELALGTGEISRHLEPDELSKLAPAALKALQVMLADDPSGSVTNHRFGAVAALLTADANAFADAFVGAVEADECSDEELLVLAVVLASRLRAAAGDVDDARLRALWEVAAPLAAGLDVRPDPNGSHLARAREFVWDPGDNEDCNPPLGDPPDQRWIGIPAEQLASIRQEVELMPRRVLSLDSWLAANFDWLEAAKVRGADVEHWWDRHASLIDALGAVPTAARTHLDARRPPAGTAAWAAVPQATLACVLHLLTDSPHATRAGRALVEAVAFAPRLVARDLVLCRTVLAGWYKA